MTEQRTALITGATGYIGSRLAPRLLTDGWRLRVLTRDADRLREREWLRNGLSDNAVEVVEGDASKAEDVTRACEGADTAYYLLHSMDGGDDFVARDRALADTFGGAARAAGVGRIIYLSGLHPSGELSEHLGSRVEVGEHLMASGVPTAVLQAAVIVGSGSASFEMLRHLTERLPVMIAPKWLDNQIQPIAIRDVLTLLAGAARLDPPANRTFDIAGPQVLTYRQMIEHFAEVGGLRKRRVITVPVLTPWLASHWVGAVTPVPQGIAKPLVGSLLHEVTAKEHDLADQLGLDTGDFLSFDDAIRAALDGDSHDRPEPGDADPAVLSAADPSWAGSGRSGRS